MDIYVYHAGFRMTAITMTEQRFAMNSERERKKRYMEMSCSIKAEYIYYRDRR